MAVGLEIAAFEASRGLASARRPGRGNYGRARHGTWACAEVQRAPRRLTRRRTAKTPARASPARGCDQRPVSAGCAARARARAGLRCLAGDDRGANDLLHTPGGVTTGGTSGGIARAVPVRPCTLRPRVVTARREGCGGAEGGAAASRVVAGTRGRLFRLRSPDRAARDRFRRQGERAGPLAIALVWRGPARLPGDDGRPVTGFLKECIASPRGLDIITADCMSIQVTP
jgi:hypothetical protein